MHIVVDYFYLLYFFYQLNFYCFCSFVSLGGLYGLWAHSWVTVSASLPSGRFCLYLCLGLISTHLSVALL